MKLMLEHIQLTSDDLADVAARHASSQELYSPTAPKSPTAQFGWRDRWWLNQTAAASVALHYWFFRVRTMTRAWRLMKVDFDYQHRPCRNPVDVILSINRHRITGMDWVMWYGRLVRISYSFNGLLLYWYPKQEGRSQRTQPSKLLEKSLKKSITR